MIDTQSEKFNTAQGEVEIAVPQMGGIAAGKLILRLVKQHGPAVGKLSAALKGDASAVGDAIGALASNLDEQEFEALLLKLTKGARVNTGEEFEDMDQKVLERLFRGHTGDLFKLVWFALRVNYTNFFAEFAALIPKPKTVIPSKSVSASNSEGLSISIGQRNA